MTNALTALTLLGVPVANTTLDNVLTSLRNVVAVATASLGAEVEFTLRPRNSRPRIVESLREENTFEVRFLENAIPHQEVQVETVLFSVHSGTVALFPVPEDDEAALRESMMDELERSPGPRLQADGQCLH